MNDYQEYLEKYARDHNLTVEEAEKHELMIYVKRYYQELEKERQE